MPAAAEPVPPTPDNKVIQNGGIFLVRRFPTAEKPAVEKPAVATQDVPAPTPEQIPTADLGPETAVHAPAAPAAAPLPDDSPRFLYADESPAPEPAAKKASRAPVEQALRIQYPTLRPTQRSAVAEAAPVPDDEEALEPGASEAHHGEPTIIEPAESPEGN